ncbi:hypothetical protein OG21DRAFT_935102 [Imleria badia]|nr:hypothetical protein OG21DRAFT_935102 [Imleria badia]
MTTCRRVDIQGTHPKHVQPRAKFPDGPWVTVHSKRKARRSHTTVAFRGNCLPIHNQRICPPLPPNVTRRSRPPDSGSLSSHYYMSLARDGMATNRTGVTLGASVNIITRGRSLEVVIAQT